MSSTPIGATSRWIGAMNRGQAHPHRSRRSRQVVRRPLGFLRTMAPDDSTDYASECARLAELTDNQVVPSVNRRHRATVSGDRCILSGPIGDLCHLKCPSQSPPTMWKPVRSCPSARKHQPHWRAVAYKRCFTLTAIRTRTSPKTTADGGIANVISVAATEAADAAAFFDATVVAASGTQGGGFYPFLRPFPVEGAGYGVGDASARSSLPETVSRWCRSAARLQVRPTFGPMISSWRFCWRSRPEFQHSC
jgi:hypothetical protein